MSKPKYISDIEKMAADMPFGELSVRLQRHRSKTSKVTFVKDSKIAPTSNVEAFNDLEKLINALIVANFDGKLQFAIDMKSGTIKLITIKNKEIKTYGQST